MYIYINKKYTNIKLKILIKILLLIFFCLKWTFLHSSKIDLIFQKRIYLIFIVAVFEIYIYLSN